MTAGKMDEQITLQRATATPDGGGGVTEVWGDLPDNATVWASVKAKAGRESMDDGRTNATFVVLFEIYNRSDIDERDRIMWGGLPYNIRGIRREGGRALRLVIEAERGVAS